jgi:hypothetical protein
VAVIVPDVVAIAAVDPGRVTGVARGVFRLDTEMSVAEAFQGADEFESWECEGSDEEQAIELTEELADWFAGLNIGGIAIPNLHLVFEDFQLRTRFASLEPVEVRAAFNARWTWKVIDIQLQQPSHAKTYATDDRLRRWGAWQKGSTHRRDATRHLLLKLNKVLG